MKEAISLAQLKVALAWPVWLRSDNGTKLIENFNV